MSVNYLHKRSGTADKRPTAASLDIGELALNYESGDPGLFFEDSAGNVRKVGPVTVGATAPNASPAGSSGNSTGELWLDTTNSGSVLKIWNGSAWVVIEGQTGANTADTQVLFSDAGVITGDTEFTYDADNNTLTVEHLHGDLSGMVQFECEASVAISKGDVVYVDGVQGNNPTVNLAQANSASTMPAFGIASEDIALGATGHVTILGSLGNLDTSTPSFSLGDTLYVSATTAGGLVNTPPAGETNLIQNMGLVERVSATVGRVKVNSAGRTSATPNLNDGNIFVGNASNQSVSDAFTDVLAAQSGITTNANDLTVDRHILPDTNITYDLGSSTQRFRDIYLSTNTIYMGETQLSVDAGTGTLAVGGEDLVKASDPVVTGDVNLADNASIDLFEAAANGTNYLAFKAPAALSSTTTLILPDGDGTTQQVLQTDGSGNLSWASVTTAVAPIFSGNPSLSNAGEFRWLETTANGTDYIAFKAPDSVTTSTVLTLPDGDGSANQLLQTDGSGALSWTTNTLDKLPLLEIFVGDASGNTSTESFSDVLTTVTGISLTASEITVTGRDLGISNQQSLNLYELAVNGSNAIEFRAPASLTATTTFTLPDGDGTDGQVLKTNGSGVLSWEKPVSGITDNSTEVLLTLTSDGDLVTEANAHLDVAEYTFYVDGTDYKCGINTNGPQKALDIYGYDNPDTIACHSFQPNDFAPAVYFIKGRGSNTNIAALNANDRLGMHRYFGYDGTNEVYGAQWFVEAQDVNMNTCTYHWESNISGTNAERLQITSTGELQTAHGFITDNNTGIKLRETTANGTNHIELKAPASVTADTTLTLPDGDGVSGQTMITDGSGNLSFGGFGINAHASFDASAGGSFNWSTDKIAEGNITSVTRTAEGKFTITFDRDFAGAAYTAVCTAGDQDYSGASASPRAVNVVSRSAGSMDIVVERTDDAAQDDCGYIAVMVIGVLS